MKRILAFVLVISILVVAMAATAMAASDTCIKFSDTTGATGYSAGSGQVNSYAVQNGGATLIFDVKLESLATPTSGYSSRIFAFSGDSNYNYGGFDFTDGEFKVGESTQWITSANSASYSEHATKSFDWKVGQWYEIAYQFDENNLTVFLDGTPMVSADVGGDFSTEYLIFYPQYCTVLIDNLRVCGKDYNVRDRYGDVYATTNFTGVTTATGVSCWDFSGTGFSVSTAGRTMPELSAMLPERTVSPEISGAYLSYSEYDGTGTVPAALNFTQYEGFTMVEDIRIASKSTLSNFGVRFGDNYIAGYDFGTGSFIISDRSGNGFSTASSAVYAKTAYTLNLNQTYEFAVRQSGEVVSVYLNGVLMVQAGKAAFANKFSAVEMTCYKVDASIDNFVVAYPDYNVREAMGSTVAKLTFDESRDYINDAWDFDLGSGKNGYSVVTPKGYLGVTVDSVEAEEGKATVNVSFTGCKDFSAFELRVSYDSAMTVSNAIAATRFTGSSVISDNSKNPFVMAYADSSGNAVTDGNAVKLIFNTPEAQGNYSVTATLIPYYGDIEGASIVGTGTVTVPEPGLPVGFPDGVLYDGYTLSWNPVSGASDYSLYLLYEGDKNEYDIDVVSDTSYDYAYEDYIPDPGMYTFRIYANDASGNTIGVSKDLDVFVTEDSDIYVGIDTYAEEYYAKLEAYVKGKSYSSENQSIVNGYLENARIEMMNASDFDTVTTAYDDYLKLIKAVPVLLGYVPGDVDGNGSCDNKDLSILRRYIGGSGVTVSTEAADMNSDGAVNGDDAALLKTLLRTGG